jgi:hypothetical protein
MVLALKDRIMLIARRILLVTLAASAWGCSSTTSALKARYARERSCPEDQVRVSPRGGVIYEASGCGETAEYACPGVSSWSRSAAASCAERGVRGQAPAGELRRFPEPPGPNPEPGAPMNNR